MTAHPLTATSSTADPTPCTVRQVPAGDLRIGDTVIDHGTHRRIGTIRIQGAQPIAVIAYTDSQQLHHYPARQPLIILDPHPVIPAESPSRPADSSRTPQPPPHERRPRRGKDHPT